MGSDQYNGSFCFLQILDSAQGVGSHRAGMIAIRCAPRRLLDPERLFSEEANTIAPLTHLCHFDRTTKLGSTL